MGRGGTKPTEQSAYRVSRRGWGGVGPNPLSRVTKRGWGGMRPNPLSRAPIECQEGMGRGGTKPTEQSAYRVSRRGWGGMRPKPTEQSAYGEDGEGWNPTH